MFTATCPIGTRSLATFEDAIAVLEEAKQIQAHLAAQNNAISKIVDGMLSEL